LSRPHALPDGGAAQAHAALPESDAAAFERLATALLASPAAPLGPLLRAQLPGTAGVRWLRQEGLAPTTPPTALARDQWLSLFACWTTVSRAPSPRGGARRSGGRTSSHGHAPGAMSIPRWGS
jgi:hypothetical protein